MSSADPSSSSGGERNPVEILAEEFAERHRRGEKPTVEEYTQRYPEHSAEIRDLFPMLVMMEKARSDTGSTSHTVEPPPGLEHLGEYQIVREIGRGGMGVVYEANHERLSRRVALKVLPEKAAVLSPRKLERFQREAQAAARLHHTNIVPVFEVGSDQDLHYFAMQHIEGRALNELIEEMRSTDQATSLCGELAPVHGTLHHRRVAEIGCQLAGAIAYAHAAGTLHRDIKPGNILIDGSGVAWLADFGLAKFDESTLDLTATGAVLGTLRYMAPEQREGEPTASSDIYSLGVTLRELATLQRPGETRPTKHPRLPRDLDTVLQKATQDEASLRYASAQEFAEDLRRFQDDEPVLARRAGLLERSRRWCQRNPALALSTGVAIVAVIAAGVVGWTGYVNTRDALYLESVRKQEAQEATQHAEDNMQLSLSALEEIFDSLVPQDDTRRRPGAGWRRGGQGRGFQGRGPGPPVEQEKAVLQSLLSFFDKLAARNRTNAKLQVAAARAYRRVARLQSNLGEEAASLESRERIVRLFEELANRYPDNLSHRVDWIEARLEAVENAIPDNSSVPAENPEMAPGTHSLHTELQEISSVLDPMTVDTARVAILKAQLLRMQALVGSTDADASPLFEAALAYCGTQLDQNPPPKGSAVEFGRTLSAYANYLREQKQHNQALDMLDRVDVGLARGPRRPLRMIDPRTFVLDEKAWTYDELGDFSAADKARDDARALRRPGGPPHRRRP